MKPQARKSLRTFPRDRYSDEVVSFVEKQESRAFPFGVLGINDNERLVVGGDDGWVVGYDLQELDTVGVSVRKKARTTLAELSMPEEFMFERIVTDWIWVNPRFRYLTYSNACIVCGFPIGEHPIERDLRPLAGIVCNGSMMLPDDMDESDVHPMAGGGPQ